MMEKKVETDCFCCMIRVTRITRNKSESFREGGNKMIQRKHMKKRTICAMIAAIMAMGTVLTPAFAEETDTEPGSILEETIQTEDASSQETEEQAVPETEQTEELEEEDIKADEQENRAEPEVTEDADDRQGPDLNQTESASDTEAAESEEQADAEIEALYAQKMQEISLVSIASDSNIGVVYLGIFGKSYRAKSSGDGEISYSSSNPSIFTVDKDGEVMPKSCGTADLIIKASATKNYKEAVRKIRITVNPKPNPTYIHRDPIVVYLGHAPVKLTVETLEYGKKGIEYIPENSEMVRVNKDGTVSFLKPGYTAINAHVPETETTADCYAGGHMIKVLYNGFYREGNDLYYYKDTYYPSYGWNTINGFSYYMGTNGVIRTGFKNIDGSQYYFWPDTVNGHYKGTLAKNWQTLNGFKYYMGSDGIISTGFRTISGRKYYFWPATANGHYKGTLATGWPAIDGNKYYAGTDGVIRTGWQTLNGFKYYMGTDGAIRTGFKNIDGKQYYFWPETANGKYRGTMATKWNTINGFRYYMGTDGAIRTGWQTIDGKKYYFWPETANGHYKGTLKK